jgi:chorismate dehydratase
MAALTLGSVPYLNARPLVEGLRDVVLDVPSRLTERFRRGEVDVALVPVFEAVRDPARVLVPGIVIASPGPVDSVVFLSKRPLVECRSVLLDRSSLTSAALARILLEERLGLTPEYGDCGPEMDPREVDADAVLLIGDPAMTAPRDGLIVSDLAVLWNDWTGLPFCFAAWLARDERAAAEALGPLTEAKEAGLARRPEIAAAAAGPMRLPAEELLTYLTERITYDLGPAEREGLARYGEMCRRLGLV